MMKVHWGPDKENKVDENKVNAQSCMVNAQSIAEVCETALW